MESTDYGRTALRASDLMRDVYLGAKFTEGIAIEATTEEVSSMIALVTIGIVVFSDCTLTAPPNRNLRSIPLLGWQKREAL